MGYTHYWEKNGPINPKRWAAAFDTIQRQVLRRAPMPLDVQEVKRPRKKVPDRIQAIPGFNGIYINGAPPDGYEILAIPRHARGIQEDDREYIKTGLDRIRPYDLIVTACLIVIGEVPGVLVTSDGEPSEWEKSRLWLQGILGRPVKLPDGVTCHCCHGTGKIDRRNRYWAEKYPHLIECPREAEHPQRLTKIAA